MALPESLELQPAFNRYQDPEAAPSDGRVRVLLGSHGKLRSPITDVGRLAYLHVQLRDGKAWRHQPPADHDVA
jgi:redox-sensitive bicupin YhaK (pirin superfamily)